jgi:hypothetical protein
MQRQGRDVTHIVNGRFLAIVGDGAGAGALQQGDFGAVRGDVVRVAPVI